MSDRSETTAGKPRVTIVDVALEVGLARTTVSDILNRDVAGRYSADTRERVYRAVRKLGYAPSRAAQQLARGSSRTVGLLLLRDFSNPYFARIAHVVERELRGRGFYMNLAVTDGDADSERQRIAKLQGDDVNGLVIGPVYEPLDVEQHPSFFHAGFPVVTFGGEIGHSGFDSVGDDRGAALQEAIAMLTARGHRRIAFLCAPPSRHAPDEPNEQYVGVAALISNGVYQPRWVFWQADTGRLEDIAKTIARFADAWHAASPAERPTAAICLNDQVALAALSGLAGRGIRVPADVSIVGYDNLPESAYLVPALTTFDSQLDQQMVRAVDLLIDRVTTGRREPRRENFVPRLVERQSVADAPRI